MLDKLIDKRPWLVLAAILLLGMFLRTYCLGCESIWVDEGHSILWAKQNPADMVEAVSKDVHPPLYYLILHYWISLFGDSEFAIRFLSVIFGTVSIFMIYKTGHLLFSRRTGLLAAFILSISVFHIHYSQEIRGYSLMVLMSIASMYFFIKILEERKPFAMAGYIISSTLLVYTHFFGIFVILAQNVFFFARLLSYPKTRESYLKKWISLQIILFLAYVPWLGFLIRQTEIVQAGHFLGWIPVPTPLSIIITLFEYTSYYSIHAPILIITTSVILSLLFICLFLNSFISLNGIRPRIRRISREYNLLFTWLTIPILLPFIMSYFLASIYWTRFTIAASIAFYLLVARGIDETKNKIMKSTILFIIVALSLTGIWGYYAVTDKEQWRETVAYVESNGKDGDLILLNKWYCHVAFDYYFNETLGVDRELFPKWDFIVDADNIKSLPSVVDGRERVWVVLSHDGDPNGFITESLELLGYGEKQRHDFRSIELYLFEEH